MDYDIRYSSGRVTVQLSQFSSLERLKRAFEKCGGRDRRCPAKLDHACQRACGHWSDTLVRLEFRLQTDPATAAERAQLCVQGLISRFAELQRREV